MSYYDPDQLPFGTSPFDAPGMGISPSDSQFTAAQKYSTELVRQGMESHANFLREMDATLQTGASTAGVAGGVAGIYGASNYVPSQLSRLLRQLGPGKITDTKSLASLIEEKRSKLERTRLQETRGLKRGAAVAWMIAAVLLCIVLFHVQFFNASYRQVSYEYFTVRIALLVALFCGWKCTSKVRRAFTQAEKESPLQLQALREALDQANAKDWKPALNRDPLTPEFISDFNAHFKKKSGKDMPYLVYRYNEIFDRRLCLVSDASNLNEADLQHGKIIGLDDVRAMKTHQGA
ncbi:hypothetical protein [Massilia brevitalea]|uniref:hypothetical protein n=1 Tax=Massilia brevitalea TaxID=442526 RepID=UPI0027398780|nr:hypothetical protein [Massilia brevitalea]